MLQIKSQEKIINMIAQGDTTYRALHTLDFRLGAVLQGNRLAAIVTQALIILMIGVTLLMKGLACYLFLL